MRNALPLMLLVFAAGPLCGPVCAAEAQRAEDLIRARMQERFPDIQVRSVGPTAWTGVYEVVAADGIIYTDATADHAMSGSIIDTLSKQNLTEARWNAADRIEFGSLPLARAIRTVKGDGSRVLAVFADPDCPYCRKLEKAMQGMTNLTVYTFLYPLAEIHPNATRHARQIWCAADAPASWSAWMIEQQAPGADDQEARCANEPIGELAALGKQLNIVGTPTLFLADGTRIRGSLERDELEQRLAIVPTAANRRAELRLTRR